MRRRQLLHLFSQIKCALQAYTLQPRSEDLTSRASHSESWYASRFGSRHGWMVRRCSHYLFLAAPTSNSRPGIPIYPPTPRTCLRQSGCRASVPADPAEPAAPRAGRRPWRPWMAALRSVFCCTSSATPRSSSGRCQRAQACARARSALSRTIGALPVNEHAPARLARAQHVQDRAPR